MVSSAVTILGAQGCLACKFCFAAFSEINLFHLTIFIKSDCYKHSTDQVFRNDTPILS